jgi:C4-dicarboxylate transporter, DctQ subunit
MKLALKILDQLEEWMISLLIVGATLVIFVAVLHRKASEVTCEGVQDWLQYHYWISMSCDAAPGKWLNDMGDWLLTVNLSWSQELCIYMFVWMAKFGAAYGVRTGIHVGVDVLVNMLPPHIRKQLVLFSLFCGAAFTAIIATFGARFVWALAHTDQTSPDMEVPIWIVYLAIPCGSYLMSFRFLQVMWHFWRTGELPHHDQGYVEGVDEAAKAGIVPDDAGVRPALADGAGAAR